MFLDFEYPDNLTMAFALAARIGLVVIDGPGCQFLHLIRLDSSDAGSKKS